MAKRNANWRQDVASEMIRQIEAGTAPWQRPWKAGVIGHQPHNGQSGTPYHGINALWLEMQDHDDPRWMTYKQAAKMDVQVRGGEKSTQVEYWMWTEARPVIENGKPVLDENGKPKKEQVRLQRPKVFYAHVFNAEQIDGLAPYKAPEPSFEPVQEAERLLKLGGVKIVHDQNVTPFYQPFHDQIHLPAKAAFEDAYGYYATALHELGHATGHKSRLARDFGPFGSDVYAREELRAEMTSYMLARELGLGHNPERHAPYVESWLKAVKEDHNVLFQAARDADQMATWIKEPDLRQELERSAQQKKEGKTMDRTTQDQSVKPAQDKSKRTYLAVPFTEKDQAKAAGAKWDRKAKSWYAPEGVGIEPLKKWHLENQPTAEKKEVDPIKEFADELDQHGIAIKGEPVMDGKWHRAPLADDAKGKQNASYRAFLDGRPNGQIKNFKTDKIVRWVATGERLSRDEIEKLKADAIVMRAQRKKERLAAQNYVAKASQKRFAEGLISSLSKLGHPYLKTKKVSNLGLRYDKNNTILIPARDIDGKLWSIQTIDEHGEKRFAMGGRKSGLMHVIDPNGKISDQPASGKNARIGKGTLIIAEGYATAASIHEATKRPTVVAFDAGNLMAVAKAVRKKYPDAQIVIAGDNDHKLDNKPQGNVGKKKALEAAQAVGGRAVVPEFTAEQKAQGLSDWNDLANASGKAAIVSQMHHQPQQEKKQTAKLDREAEGMALGM